MTTRKNFSESVSNVVSNNESGERIFAQAVKDGKEKSVKKAVRGGGAGIEALERSNQPVQQQRSWLIYAEREFAGELKTLANEHFAKVVLGGETVEGARFAVRRLIGAKLMQDGASKGRQMFKATLRKIAKEMQETGWYYLPSSDKISETRRNMKEEAKAIKIAAEAKVQAAKIEAAAATFGITTEQAKAMFAAGVLKLA